jgi:hypothetical protein
MARRMAERRVRDRVGAGSVTARRMAQHGVVGRAVVALSLMAPRGVAARGKA